MGVSKNSGTPKWMVKIREHSIKMDDLGIPQFFETPIYIYIYTRYIKILNGWSYNIRTISQGVYLLKL